MSAYDAICFDLDRTICEPTQDRNALLETAFDRVGVEPFCTNETLRAVSEELPPAETDQEYFEGMFAGAAKRAGVDTSVAPELAATSLELIDPTRVGFRPGAEAALERASEYGPVGLITNGSEETQTQKLESLGIADWFDTTVFVDPANGVPPKPDPAPFEQAVSDLDVDITETVHIGDTLHADIAGANAVGMDSVWINLGYETGVDRTPTYELSSLERFESIV